MTTEIITETPLLATLRNLETGQSATFPIERTSYLRSACTTFSPQWHKTFTTKTDRRLRTITVTRTK